MPKRNFLNLAVVTLKGIAMGAADVVPGVSGGTIAFISGIYEELIESIHKLDLGFFKLWKKEGVMKAWHGYNLSFLFALILGVLISILSLSKLITELLKTEPIMVWSFFFGLVLASILFVGKQITKWNWAVILAVIIGTVIAYWITLARPAAFSDSTWFLFLAGFVAIIAMILPGISGAFILLLMGAYTNVIGTVSDVTEGLAAGDWNLVGKSALKLFVFALGAITGLKVFSRILNYMFKHYKNITLAVLTGFMIGALNKIWPWKEVLQYRTNHKGVQVPLIEKSILPSDFSGDPKLIWALVLIAAGFLTIFLLERISVKMKAD